VGKELTCPSIIKTGTGTPGILGEYLSHGVSREYTYKYITPNSSSLTDESCTRNLFFSVYTGRSIWKVLSFSEIDALLHTNVAIATSHRFHLDFDTRCYSVGILDNFP
jgi:hypothetical protein